MFSPEIPDPVRNPAIIRTAAELGDGIRSSWALAKKTALWVHENTEYEISVPDPVACLETGKGDSAAQSLLLASLLRAGGIPARIVGGLLYNGEKFGKHSWVEAWMGDVAGWIPLDPATGEAGRFSASHIALWEGEGDLARETTGASIEILEIRRKSDEIKER